MNPFLLNVFRIIQLIRQFNIIILNTTLLFFTLLKSNATYNIICSTIQYHYHYLFQSTKVHC